MNKPTSNTEYTKMMKERYRDYVLPAYLDLPQNNNPTTVLELVHDTFLHNSVVGKMDKEEAIDSALEHFKCNNKMKTLYKNKYK
jgi:hypothetical protein